MLNAKVTRALLAVLVLGAVPAMAAIPPQVEIRLGGAESVGLDHFVVHEGDSVTLAAYAEAGDTIRLFASPIGKYGNIDWTMQTDLLFEKEAPRGQVSGSFSCPKGLAGSSFALLAVAQNARGEVGHSNWIQIDVVEAK
jgi:hypothetical protein